MKKPNIVLSRVDNRLLHGQVVTSWIPHSGANLAIVANDDVSANKSRQMLMDMVAPKGIGIRYFSLQKTIDIIHKASDKQKIAIILESPQDALTLVKGGVPIETLNIGNMHMAEGKKQITKAVCVGEDDIATFKGLIDNNVTVEIQRVPTEGKESISKFI